jgi:hypothetical protein
MPDDSKTTDQLKRIIELLQDLNIGQDTIIGQNKQIIALLTPAPDNDIASLGGSISTPKKINP